MAQLPDLDFKDYVPSQTTKHLDEVDGSDNIIVVGNDGPAKMPVYDVKTTKKIVFAKSLADLSSAISVQNLYMNDNAGTLSITGSSSYKTYLFRVDAGLRLFIKAGHNDVRDLVCAFLKAPQISNRFYISGVPSVVGVGDYVVDIPNGCLYVAVSTRTPLVAEPVIHAVVNDFNLSDYVLTDCKCEVADSYENGILYSGKIDRGFFRGYVSNVTNKITSENGHCAFIIENKGYEKLVAYIGTSGIDYWAVAFYSSEHPSDDSFISGVGSFATSSPYYVAAEVPSNCKSILVSDRIGNNANPVIKLYSSVKSFLNNPGKGENPTYSEDVRNALIQHRWSWEGVHDGRDNAQYTTLMWFSDLHGDKQAFQKMMFLKKLFFNDLVEDIVHTGDVFNDHYEAGANVLTSDIINIPGNHDAYLNTSHELISSPTLYYNELLKDKVGLWGVVQPSNAETDGKCYFYKDYENSNLRIIFLDSQNYSGWNGFFDDSGAQNTWLTNVLNDAKENEKEVVVVSHYPPKDINQDWENNGFCTMKDVFHTTRFYAVDVVEDFVSNGGKFVCWMCGHQHDDQFGVCGTFELPVIQIASENIHRNENTARRFDSLSEHNFNFVTFDTAKKLIKVTKYGSNFDEFLRPRHSMCFNYATKVLISSN